METVVCRDLPVVDISALTGESCYCWHIQLVFFLSRITTTIACPNYYVIESGVDFIDSQLFFFLASDVLSPVNGNH